MKQVLYVLESARFRRYIEIQPVFLDLPIWNSLYVHELELYLNSVLFPLALGKCFCMWLHAVDCIVDYVVDCIADCVVHYIVDCVVDSAADCVVGAVDCVVGTAD